MSLARAQAQFDRMANDPIPQLSPRAVEAVEIIVAQRQAASGWWADWCSKMDGHAFRLEAHELNIEAAINVWREGWARDADFIPRWNAMTVDEVIAFQRAEQRERDDARFNETNATQEIFE